MTKPSNPPPPFSEEELSSVLLGWWKKRAIPSDPEVITRLLVTVQAQHTVIKMVVAGTSPNGSYPNQEIHDWIQGLLKV